MAINKLALKNEALKELARRDFFTYCCLTAADFYMTERTYLQELCFELQDFLPSKDDVFVINLPPRHGKSRTGGKLVEWIFGRDPAYKVMTGSYNEILSTTFAKSVRNTIAEQKAQADKLVYADIFPNVRIKQGDGAMGLWSLIGGYNNYLATSPSGTATGFGADLIFIDDLIKTAFEANNAKELEKHWNWFTDTMLSRLEAGGKIIIMMTRWHSDDLAGRALKELPKIGYKVRHLSQKALQDDGSMLCEDLLPKEEYNRKTKAMGLEIASANYQQIPIDIGGRLYSGFKTYLRLPSDEKGNLLFSSIRNYTDTADTGSDYLCSIDYGVYEGEAYILNVLYTKKPMEETEPAQAKMMFEDCVNIADIESNSGGRGYARQVERLLKEKYKTNSVVIQPFHQSKNKVARIASNATWLMAHVYFPINWRERWSEFYEAVSRYQKEGKNLHDDAPDALTGIAEKIGSGATFSFD